MAVVSIDGSVSTMGMGEVGVIYSETLILTGLVGGLFLLVMYRLTFKPFQILNEDMDKGLKGDITQVTHEFQFRRAQFSLGSDQFRASTYSAGDRGRSAVFGECRGRPPIPSSSWDRSAQLREAAGMGLVFCGPDRKIISINPMFEELSGIRAESAVGEEIGSVARDQSLGSFVLDLFDRAAPGGEGVSDDYEFSGIACKVYAVAFGNPGDSAKAFALTVLKKTE